MPAAFAVTCDAPSERKERAIYKVQNNFIRLRLRTYYVHAFS